MGEEGGECVFFCEGEALSPIEVDLKHVFHNYLYPSTLDPFGISYLLRRQTRILAVEASQPDRLIVCRALRWRRSSINFARSIEDTTGAFLVFIDRFRMGFGN